MWLFWDRRRGAVQVEMSLTDARILGITIPVNLSGDLKGAADVILVGPKVFTMLWVPSLHPRHIFI